SLKSTGNLDIFKTYQPTQESNHFSQILVSQQVFIRITTDGCAFYSISEGLQPCFLLFSFACFFFLQI
ncbi:hypothetical protein N5D81_15765, partial [Acinetobacter junii]|nr:hypothetical protein [Acinetobacter junii]